MPQNLRLGGQAQFRNFVQKQGPLMRQFKVPDPPAWASVKDPFSWPNNSLSIRVSGMAAQLTGMKGLFLRGCCSEWPGPPALSRSAFSKRRTVEFFRRFAGWWYRFPHLFGFTDDVVNWYRSSTSPAGAGSPSEIPALQGFFGTTFTPPLRRAW